jgi:hypothetical protein
VVHGGDGLDGEVEARMSKPDPLALSARFMEACGFEVSHSGGLWLYRPSQAGGVWYQVRDLTAEDKLGMVVRMARERWPARYWRIELQPLGASGGPCTRTEWLAEGERAGSWRGWTDDRQPSENISAMLTAIDASGLERPEGW